MFWFLETIKIKQWHLCIHLACVASDTPGIGYLEMLSPTCWKPSFHKELWALGCSSHPPSLGGGGWLEAVGIQLNSTPLFRSPAVTVNWNSQMLQSSASSRTIKQASGHIFIIKFICHWSLSWSSWVFDDDSWISSLKGLTVAVEEKKKS